MQPPLEFLLVLALVCTVLSHLLLVLFCRWSVWVESKVRFSACALSQASTILVYAAKSRGKAALCPLHAVRDVTDAGSASGASLGPYFDYQSRKYFVDRECLQCTHAGPLTFHKAQLPIGRCYGFVVLVVVVVVVCLGVVCASRMPRVCICGSMCV
jgi:hypothetical protein